ncbi:MAG: hypothetical protein ACYDCP_10985 [Thermoplasmataceae archaeon]
MKNNKKFNYNDLDLVRVLIKRTCKELGINSDSFSVVMSNNSIDIIDYLNGYGVSYLYIIFERKDIKHIKTYINEASVKHKDYLAKQKEEEVKRQTEIKKHQEEFDKLSPEGKIIVSLVATLILVIYAYNSPPPPAMQLSFYPANNSTLLDIYNNPAYRGW